MIKLFLRDFSAYDKIIDTQTQFSCKIAGQNSGKQLFRLHQTSHYDTSPVRRHWHRSGVFIVNFEHISHLVLVFLLLTLNIHLPAGRVFLYALEHLNLFKTLMM